MKTKTYIYTILIQDYGISIPGITSCYSLKKLKNWFDNHYSVDKESESYNNIKVNESVVMITHKNDEGECDRVISFTKVRVY